MVRGLNPVGELLKRADQTITAAGGAMADVDAKLAGVDEVLGEVGGTLDRVDQRMADVDARLAETTAMLASVRGVLDELSEEIALVKEVPRLREQLDEVLSRLQA